MSDKRTPLQDLDDAVHEYVASSGGDDGAVLGGWVLAFQTSFIMDSGPTVEPIVWGGNYAISPGASPFAAAGLAAHVQGVIERVMLDAQFGDED